MMGTAVCDPSHAITVVTRRLHSKPPLQGSMSEIAIFRPTTRGSLVLAKESELWETVGMAKPKARYVPRMNDPVTVEGVQGTLVVVGIDARTRTALVQTMTPPQVVHRVSWTTVSCLDESQKRSLQSS